MLRRPRLRFARRPDTRRRAASGASSLARVRRVAARCVGLGCASTAAPPTRRRAAGRCSLLRASRCSVLRSPRLLPRRRPCSARRAKGAAALRRRLLVAGAALALLGGALALAYVGLDRGWVAPAGALARALPGARHRRLAAPGRHRLATGRAQRRALRLAEGHRGGDWTDPRFADNWREARAAGLRVGAYHFFTFCRPPQEQAQHFLLAARRRRAAAGGRRGVRRQLRRRPAPRRCARTSRSGSTRWSRRPGDGRSSTPLPPTRRRPSWRARASPTACGSAACSASPRWRGPSGSSTPAARWPASRRRWTSTSSTADCAAFESL